MPYSFNGCGTRLYGRRDLSLDGSYVTTEWITFLWVPLIPIRSQRIFPTGKGTNLVVYNSQSYLTKRVPFCWPQVRNVYLFTGPVLVLVLSFNWSDMHGWVKNDLLADRAKPVANPIPSERVLRDSEASATCGKLLKLDRAGLQRLNLHERINSLVRQSDFSSAVRNGVATSDDLEEQAFGGYSLGYLTWDKPAESVRSEMDKKVIAEVQTHRAGLSGQDLVDYDEYGNKTRQMLMTSIDMGRRDGRTSPCPY